MVIPVSSLLPRRVVVAVVLALVASSAGAQVDPARQSKQTAKMMREAKRWERGLADAQRLLQDGDFTAALEVTRMLYRELAPSIVAGGEQAESTLGTVYGLHALALAGSGDEEEALWHWRLAQSLAPALGRSSLAAYGVAGDRLRPHRLAPPREDEERNRCRLLSDEAGREAKAPAVEAEQEEEPLAIGKDVKAPIRVHTPAPQYSEAAREARVRDTVVVQTVIDRKGQVKSLCILRTDVPALAHQAALALRDWTFEPATLEGEPMDVYYNLTVNFTVE